MPLTVTGVMRDLPHNTQLYIDMLVPNTSIVDRLDQEAKHNWLSNNSTFGYVVLAPGADPAQVVAKTKPMIDRSADLSRYINIKMPGSQIMQVRLVPFRDAHLTTDQYFGMKPAGSYTTLYGMGAIGLVDPAGRLLQLHESGHGAGHHAGARNLPAQMRRRHARPADGPVPGRSRC